MAQAALVFILGILVGLIIGYILRPMVLGTLRIDRTNPAADIYRIDIDEIDDLANHKRVILNIDANANFTHE